MNWIYLIIGMLLGRLHLGLVDTVLVLILAIVFESYVLPTLKAKVGGK